MTEPSLSSESTPILTIEELEHAYGRYSVLEDVSFDVQPGEITAILGPNGSGKTTLLRDLVGLLDPTAGEVSYATLDATRPIGYLQQRPSFRSGQTVREAIAFYASLVGEPEATADRRLEQVGLSEAADREVSSLSGGMTRLLGVAQAIVGDPPLVVLDEPASGLDPEMSVRIFEVVEDLAARGAAVLLSSHNLMLVERTVDAVVLLADGTVAGLGSPAELRTETDTESLLEAFEAMVTGKTGTVRVRGAST
jgi:ABC-type multidrug transport system ATPase subunit